MTTTFVITVGPGGSIVSNLSGETTESNCAQLLSLMTSLGNIVEHDPSCSQPQNVNVFLGSLGASS